ncbi:MAG TPA: alpha/beta hydrolase [Opitutaceae bacterium]|nr:alpha/beta hydrolase [Opitutaceae bacterium]
MLRRVALLTCFLCAAAFLSAADSASEPVVVPVWPGVPPGSEGQSTPETVRLFENREHVVSNVHRPSLTLFLPKTPNATHAAVLVIPGGGHREIWMDHEGYNIARALNAKGYAAFILKYRLARQEGSTYTVEQHALADATRAMRLIRSRAKEWGVDPSRLGVMGFSAGGELAALTASRWTLGDAKASDAIERESSRPTFQALIYPGNATAIRPAKDAPPAFLICGEKDRVEISRELPNVYTRFREANVSAELHILAGVGHGFGLRPKSQGSEAHWIEALLDWLDRTTS